MTLRVAGRVILCFVAFGCARAPVVPPAEPVAVREGHWPIRDTRLFVRDVGPETAPAVVVVHGGPGGNHQSLLPFEALAPGYRVVFYDQRGTGASDRLDVSPENPESLKRLSLEENVADLEALRQRLGKERIALIGHSWGGTLAVFYAAAHPERVDKLIVYSGGPEDAALQKQKSRATFARLSEEEKSRLKAGTAVLKEAVEKGAGQDELDQRFLEVARIMFPTLYCERPATLTEERGRAGFWANQIAGGYSDTFDRAAFGPQLARVTAPTLLTWGRCEPSPRERLAWMLGHLPDARLAVFEKSGHNAMTEEPVLFMDVVRTFLDGAPLPRAAKTYRSASELPPET